ncbi:MAG: hypothetical protein ACJ798_20205, partial [Phenylobacterium sp.]
MLAVVSLGPMASEYPAGWLRGPFNSESAPTGDGTVTVSPSPTRPRGQSFQVAVGPTVVLTTDAANPKSPFANFPIPVLLAHFFRSRAVREDILVVQQDSTGNACDGGPLWLLVVAKGQPPRRTPPIDWCGGGDPR